MSVESAPYYWLECDHEGCKAKSTDAGDFTAWSDESGAMEEAYGSDWATTGWTVSSGYYGQSLGSEVAQEIAEHLIGAGWVRLRLDDATVERAARGLARHKWPTAMGLWESFGQGMRDDFKDATRAVLSAAAQEER